MFLIIMIQTYSLEKRLKDENIVNYIESKKINLEQCDKDLGAKTDFLINCMGWKNLRVSKFSDYNKYCPIYLCSNERINGAVKKTYNEAKNRLNKYSNINYIQQELNFQGYNNEEI